jgi:hypothetical protein
VDDEARGLVDDEEVRVFEDDVEVDRRVRLGGGGLGRLGGDLDESARGDGGRRSRGFSGDEDAPGVDPALHGRARGGGAGPLEEVDHEFVEAIARVGGGDFESEGL